MASAADARKQQAVQKGLSCATGSIKEECLALHMQPRHQFLVFAYWDNLLSAM